jgi:D-3-phosphoglycerate dehydrogenase
MEPAMPRHRCAILDDYQNVALQSADWSKITDELDVKVFNQRIAGQDAVIKALQGLKSSAPCAKERHSRVT